MRKRMVFLCLLLIVFLTGGSFQLLAAMEDPKAGQDLPANPVTPTAYIDYSAGSNHSLAVASDGTLWAWGGNDHGQLGTGTLEDSSFPVKIGSDTDWLEVSAGENYSLALKKDGTAWSWGLNSSGQLGDGTTKNSSLPVKIETITGVAVIDAGSDYSVALKKDGSLWSWGKGEKAPGMQGMDYDWKDVSNGQSHTVAVKNDGTLWMWVAVPEMDHFTPGRVSADSDWIKAEACSRYSSIAQKSDGTLWMWGFMRSNREILQEPVKITSDESWTDFSATDILCSVNSDGSLWMWGTIGDYGAMSSLELFGGQPVQVGQQKDWSGVSAGAEHFLAVKKDGSLWSWGGNSYGQLGNGASSLIYKPTQVGNDKNWAQVTTGYNHTLAVKGDGTLWGWGNNSYYAINMIGGDVGSPERIGNVADWKYAAGATLTSYGIKSDGSLWGWGINTNREIDGERGYKTIPTRIGTDRWISVLSSVTPLGMRQDGTLWYWGMDFSGESGGMSVMKQVGKDRQWLKIAYGGGPAPTFYAIDKDGSLWGMGYNYYGQLCNGSNQPAFDFIRIGKDSDWTDAAGGQKNIYALKKDGTMWGWGIFYHKSYKVTAPARIGRDSDWVQLSIKGDHLLALKKDGTLWGMGDNAFGQIGDEVRNFKPDFIQIGKDNDWVSMSAGTQASYAIKKDGSLWAWGDNRTDALGIPADSSRKEPGRVGMRDTRNVSPQYMEITVSNAEEFVKAIGSNRKIILKPGVYDLSDIQKVDSDDGRVFWKQVEDGRELNIKDVSNLTIEGNGRNKTEIKTSPRFAHIMSFQNSSFITVKNLTAGHTPGDYICNAGVLLFSGSDNIRLDDCYLYGSGSIGINFQESGYSSVTNTDISHCSLRAVEISSSASLEFTGCRFNDNEAYGDLVDITDSADVVFKDCEISDNIRLIWGLIDVNYSRDVSFDGCKITNNSEDAVYQEQLLNVSHFINIDRYLTVQSSNVVMKNTEIKDNVFDHLYNVNKTEFENCRFDGNSFDSELAEAD